MLFLNVLTKSSEDVGVAALCAFGFIGALIFIAFVWDKLFWSGGSNKTSSTPTSSNSNHNHISKEPTQPKNSKNKYTIYSIDEAPAMAKRVLDDMPSDLFTLELISLKQNLIKLFERCKHEFVPGDDARFHVYKVLYSKTYDLLLCDECYFMGDFTPNGRAIYRLCTYCLDESHRLGYVDDDLYKAQKSNISINVRNGKSFS